jgi:hypothetical protein
MVDEQPLGEHWGSFLGWGGVRRGGIRGMHPRRSEALMAIGEK